MRTHLLAAFWITTALFGAPATGAWAEPEAAPGAVRTPAAGALSPGDRLSLDQCIEIALRKSPGILAAQSTAEAGRGRIGQARAAYYPQISLSGGYSASVLPPDPTNTRQDLYTASATLNQTIFDFGRTWNQVTVAQRTHDAARSDVRTATAAVVLNVKQAYYGLLRAEKNRDVFRETVGQFEQHLSQARAFYETGVKSKFDVTKAEVDLSNAKLNLIRGENALRIARVTLNNAMGAPEMPAYTIEDTLSFRKSELTYETAAERAFRNRPELASLTAKRQAAEASLSLARSGYLPTLSGSATYYRQDTLSPPEETGWNAGVTLTFPLFSGFLTTYQVKEASENRNTLTANEEALRQSILLDIQQSFLNLQEAEERVAVAGLTVQQAEENYAIAKGRYEAGVGNPIEETDALVALSNAKTSLIAALADCKIAEASLLRAMGE